jgi:hypothetical protein
MYIGRAGREKVEDLLARQIMLAAGIDSLSYPELLQAWLQVVVLRHYDALASVPNFLRCFFQSHSHILLAGGNLQK